MGSDVKPFYPFSCSLFLGIFQNSEMRIKTSRLEREEPESTEDVSGRQHVRGL